jgi:hypothetical protein
MDNIDEAIVTDPETPVGKYLRAFLDNCLDCKIYKDYRDMEYTDRILSCKKNNGRDDFNDKLFMRE